VACRRKRERREGRREIKIAAYLNQQVKVALGVRDKMQALEKEGQTERVSMTGKGEG